MAVSQPQPILSSAITAEQRDTAKLLRDLVGHVYADRFLDFCRLTNGDPRRDMQLRAALPLAAHAMRELESTLRKTLRGPFGKSPKEREREKAEAGRLKAAEAALLEIGFSSTYTTKAVKSLERSSGEETTKLSAAETALRELGFDGNLVAEAIKALRKPRHRAEITKICVNLGLGAESETAKNWIRLAQQQAGSAHKRSFHASPILDEEFRREYARPFQALLRDVTLAFQRKFHLFILRVDELAAQVDKAKAVADFKAEISGALTLQRRFFQKIEGTDWLDHLVREGLLGPPVPNFDDAEAGVVRWNEWPPSHYLLKVAASEDVRARKALVAALRELSDADDFGLREKCFEVAKTLPVDDATALADVAVQWLKPRFFWTLHAPEQYLRHLITGHQRQATLTVARVLLGVSCDEGTITTKYDDNDYGHSALPFVEPITALCGIDALNMFADFLEQGARGRQLIRMDPPVDLTSITHSMSDEDQARYDIYSALIVALRRSAKTLIEADLAAAPQVLQALMVRPYDIYKRIALEVAPLAVDVAPAEIRVLLTDPKLCGQSWCSRAYGVLAKIAFSKLTDEMQQAILTRVRELPAQAMPRWIEWRTQMDGTEPTEETRATFLKIALRDAVWYWREVLPQELQDEVENIARESGPPAMENPRFAWDGFRDESPVTAEDIVARPTDQLVDFLENWKPSDSKKGLTISALGTELRRAVEIDPERFAAAANAFGDIGPHYLRRLLEGLDNQVRNGHAISWAPVLCLLTKLLERAKSPISAESVAEGEDPSWSWVLISAAELLRAGHYQGKGQFPEALRPEVWQLIQALHRAAPGVVPEDFSSRLTQDAFFAARSTLEGAVLETAILFGWWSCEIQNREGEAERPLPDGVRGILDSALSRDEATDPALRAILGRFFDVLLYLDRQWVSERSSALLGAAVSQDRRDLLWQGHLLHGGLSRDSAPFFSDELAQEAERASAEGYDGDYRGRRFVEYLCYLYRIGEVDLGSDGVMDRFLARAPNALRETATWALTAELQKADNMLSSESRERIHRYYEARVEAATNAAHPADFRRELGMLALWFGKSAVDNRWMLQQLQRISALKLSPPHPSGLFDWLETQLADEIDDVITAIALLLLDDGFEKYMFHACLEQIGRILTAGAQASKVTTQQRARNCANILISFGLTDPVLLELAK